MEDNIEIHDLSYLIKRAVKQKKKILKKRNKKRKKK